MIVQLVFVIRMDMLMPLQLVGVVRMDVAAADVIVFMLVFVTMSVAVDVPMRVRVLGAIRVAVSMLMIVTVFVLMSMGMGMIVFHAFSPLAIVPAETLTGESNVSFPGLVSHRTDPLPSFGVSFRSTLGQAATFAKG